MARNAVLREIDKSWKVINAATTSWETVLASKQSLLDYCLDLIDQRSCVSRSDITKTPLANLTPDFKGALFEKIDAELNKCCSDIDEVLDELTMVACKMKTAYSKAGSVVERYRNELTDADYDDPRGCAPPISIMMGHLGAVCGWYTRRLGLMRELLGIVGTASDVPLKKLRTQWRVPFEWKQRYRAMEAEMNVLAEVGVPG